MPEYLSIATHERIEMISIGSQLAELLRKKAEDGWKDGFLAVYSPHTTCGLTINEGWDPDVKADMEPSWPPAFRRTGASGTPKATRTRTSKRPFSAPPSSCPWRTGAPISGSGRPSTCARATGRACAPCA